MEVLPGTSAVMHAGLWCSAITCAAAEFTGKQQILIHTDKSPGQCIFISNLILKFPSHLEMKQLSFPLTVCLFVPKLIVFSTGSRQQNFCVVKERGTQKGGSQRKP